MTRYCECALCKYILICRECQIEQLKKQQRDESDKFDAELEAIYAETKKHWAFYTPSNLEAQTTKTTEAQRRIKADIEVTVQETENAVAKLQVKDDGKV